MSGDVGECPLCHHWHGEGVVHDTCSECRAVYRVDHGHVCRCRVPAHREAAAEIAQLRERVAELQRDLGDLGVRWVGAVLQGFEAGDWLAHGQERCEALAQECDRLRATIATCLALDGQLQDSQAEGARLRAALDAATTGSPWYSHELGTECRWCGASGDWQNEVVEYVGQHDADCAWVAARALLGGAGGTGG